MNQYAGLRPGGANVTPICDLRSDTVTRPNEGMRKAMYEAELGDDVYGEDPQVNRLEAELAARLGKEAGLFLPTGTQSNLTAVMAHCGRGEEAIVGRGFHIYTYEAAGASVLGSVALYPLEVRADGALEPGDITAAVKVDDSHFTVSRLLCLENTHNGMAVPLADTAAAADAGRAAGLSVHLDGARYFNAIAGLGCAEGALAGLADTVSICLSKGLGTPAGSVLVGPRDVISRARRLRKMLGGGMRQAGVLAAAGLFALEHNVTRLAEDQERAEALAEALREMGAENVVQNTNMVFFSSAAGQGDALKDHMAGLGVVIGGGEGPKRLVLHKDVTDEGLAAAIDGFRVFFG